MTCVAALVHEGEVWMGADSAGADASWSLTIRRDEKIFQNGPCLFGFTTSFRMGQLLRYKLQIPVIPEGAEPLDWIHRYLVDAMRTCLREGGYLKKTNEQEEGGCFLLGFRGGLYVVESDFQVAVPDEEFWAVGCGHDLAKGVLFATKQMAAHDRLTLALEAAEHFSAGVRRPFIVRKLPKGA